MTFSNASVFAVLNKTIRIQNDSVSDNSTLNSVFE